MPTPEFTWSDAWLLFSVALAESRERGPAEGEKVGALAQGQARLEAFLDASPYPAGDPRIEDPVWPYPNLTDEKIRNAVDEYLSKQL